MGSKKDKIYRIIEIGIAVWQAIRNKPPKDEKEEEKLPPAEVKKFEP